MKPNTLNYVITPLATIALLVLFIRLGGCYGLIPAMTLTLLSAVASAFLINLSHQNWERKQQILARVMAKKG